MGQKPWDDVSHRAGLHRYGILYRVDARGAG